MLNVETMRAIGGMLARQARARVAEAEVQSNEIIDLGPLLLPWKAGTASEPVSYKAGDVRTYGGQIWKCAQAHDHHGEPGWEPGRVSMWGAYHATDAAHAMPWVAPTGAHDMYRAGEYMIWTDGATYRCIQDTAYSPAEYAQAWASAEGSDTPGGETEAPEPDWPEFVQPQGAHDAYFRGDRVTYNGVRYLCAAPEGVACVWAPDAYPAYWQAQPASESEP